MSIKRYTRNVGPAMLDIKLSGFEFAVGTAAEHRKDKYFMRYMVIFFATLTIIQAFQQSLGGVVSSAIFLVAFIVLYFMDKKWLKESEESVESWRKNIKGYFEECLVRMDEDEGETENATKENPT